MKRRLKQIYQDLFKGKLTQKEALQEIRALKQQGQEKGMGTLLSAPVWEEDNISKPADESASAFAERHIILCEMSSIDEKRIETMIPGSHCLTLRSSQQNIAERFSEIAGTCFELIKNILHKKPSGKVLLQIVIPDNQEEKLFAGLSGLLKTAALENPHIAGQIILLQTDIFGDELVKRLELEKTRHQDEVIKYDNDGRRVLRLQEISTRGKAPKIAFKDRGVYLITGGFGGLGVLFAREIIRQTSKARIILAGRSELTPARKKVLEELSGTGTSVEYRQADIADPDQVGQLITYIKGHYKQINGIIHCAGINSDNFILKKTAEEFGRVLLPKVTGTFNLDQATHDIDLDFMVLFSSVASWLGNSGQADYAAANAFMDQYAVYRNALVETNKRKGKTISVNWPLWQEGGMRMDEATQEMLGEITGLRALTTPAGMQNFYRCLELQHEQVMVTDGDYTQIRHRLFERNKDRPPVESTHDFHDVLPLATSANGSDKRSLFEKALDFICGELASQLKIAPHQLDPQAPMEKYGIDSILAMNLTNQLEKSFGSLPKTLFFEYQTAHELTEYFTKSFPDVLKALFSKNNEGSSSQKPGDVAMPKPQLQARQRSGGRFLRQRQEPVSVKNSKTDHDSDPIAIVGLSGRYPEAKDIREYWQNLRQGKDCIIEVPKDRWDWRDYYSEDRTKGGHHYSKWGGFIEGVDEFDPRFFNIAPREAANIDPQERLFLQHAWMAIEDAGYTRDSLQIADEQDLAGQVGVYVGVMYGEYQLFGARGKGMALMNSYASIANRVSYVLNLHGPSMTLDTMCSSSLTAIHLACQDLQLGRTNLAIAGGVNVSIHPNKYLYLSTGQFISSDGHCQSFGEGGDGYIPGEGVGVVILKRLSEAERDGNHIYGIIKGSALNHGGKTNGYSVPNPKAQAAAITRALSEANIDPRHISYIEAHGTGTKLGDPIEIAALNQAFKKHTEDNGFCLIGSAKSNIGHCESAAGIAGLTKVLLQLKHKEIVSSLHSQKLNPYIDFNDTPFTVNQTLTPWRQPEIEGKLLPRIAGISSFGAGGSNAHIIIQEYVPSAEVSQTVAPVAHDTTVVIPLSARTAEQLKQKATDLLDFIRAFQPDLIAMAYTLQVGREAMDERLGFVVSSIDQLADKLTAYINGEQGVADTYHGQVKRNKEVFGKDTDLQKDTEQWIAQKQLGRLLDLWVKGIDLDWSRLYGDNRPNLISLPAYPFARERYWIDTTDTEELMSNASAPVLHPLLHVNTSDLVQQCYSSTFSGNEFFFADYPLNGNGSGQKMLPAVAYLEMARAAVEKSMPAKEGSELIELHDLVWGQPFIAAENKQIAIALLTKDGDGVDFEIYSKDEAEEVIHCQGSASFVPSANQKLDTEQLKGQTKEGRLTANELYTIFIEAGMSYPAAHQGVVFVDRGVDQVLAQLRIPEAVGVSQKDYQLHPAIVDSALHAAIALNVSQPVIPFAVASIRIASACTTEMLAWVRYTLGSRATDDIIQLDIDLCDPQGNICVQMRGVACQQESLNTAAQVDIPVQTVSSPALKEPRQIPLPLHVAKGNGSGEPSQSFANVALKKPTAISLAAPDDLDPGKIKRTSAKAAVVLTDTTIGFSSKDSRSSTVPLVSLYDHGNGIFSILIEAGGTNKLSDDLTNQLLLVLNTVQKAPSVKVLILKGSKGGFLHGGRNEYNVAVEQKLYQAIASFPYPVIAAMQGNAAGAGFLVGALCDFMICSREANYYYTIPQEGIFPSDHEYQLFEGRFGAELASDFLYCSETYTGQQLQAKGWTCPILPQEQVEGYTEDLALALAKKSETSLALLKQHLARHIVKLTNGLSVLSAMTTGRMSDEAVPGITLPAKHIRLETHDNVLVIRIGMTRKKYGIKALVKDVKNIFSRIDSTSSYKSMVLVSEYPDFLPENKLETAVSEIMDLQQLSLELPIPVIAVLDSDTSGRAWFFSQFCEACIYNVEGRYSIGDIRQSPELAQQAVMIFQHRFGNYFGKEILLAGTEYSGRELQQRAGNLNIAEQGEGLSAALQLAASWTKLPSDTLMSWKKQRALSIKQKVEELPAWLETEGETFKALPASPVSINLKSEVITATAHPEGILVVKMEDREAKNMFSDAFTQGITEVFGHIEQAEEYKVVVLTGYDNYFASGGTKEALLAIQEGKSKFTDTKIYQLAMKCKLPVIAAMQGHGIGAGWAMGMFADLVLFSEESKYVSPYMTYGFTPGAGATFIFPEKTGYDLARETLLTAQEYAGDHFRDRGLRVPVLRRAQVNEAALELAGKIAKCSRSVLIALKHQFTHNLQEPLKETIELELAMHEKTFVGQQDTLQQIKDNFHQGERTVELRISKHSEPVSTQNSDPTREVPSGDSVMASVRQFLAEELHLQEHEIEEDTQFVDLGLDSVTGVTLVRRINDKYKTSIEATKIYSYPTLSELSRYVMEEAGKSDLLPDKSATVISAVPATEIQRNGEPTGSSQHSNARFAVADSIKKMLAEELHLQEHEIDEDTQFIDLGLDSITGVTWIRRINEKYKTSIEATKIYSYPTLSELSGHVKEEAEKLGTVPSELGQPVIPARPFSDHVALKAKAERVLPPTLKKLTSWRNRPVFKGLRAQYPDHAQSIAVVGMAGQFPMSGNLDDFWKNIAAGKNCISEVPQKRWDINTFYHEGEPVPGKTNSKWAGLMEGYDLFDPLFFNISPTDAESMDPQQRVLLQACWESIENAGYSPKSLSGSRCGVYMGCASGDYHLLSRELQISAQGFTGGATSILAARICYLLNLQGPCVSIDTACSSSLVAIASACDSLVSGSCDMAMAGGVYVMVGPDMHIKSSQAGMLSRDGKCHTFDQKANGFVPGEGVGVVILKRLADAQKDNDIIHGVIEGWGVNQDGKTNGITAPNEESQIRLEREVYDRFKIDPDSIQLVEAHGTGTKLGDPIEVNALKQSFKNYTKKKEYCALGSVKSNIGHCLTAAGVASFIKTLLALKHQQLPPTINYDSLNEHIALKDSPFYVNNELKEWKAGEAGKRQAAISAFGFSGTNAHIVLSEYVAPVENKRSVSVITQDSKIIVPLSAKTADQLKQKAIDLLAFIRREPSIDLVEMTYTLQIGRDAMDERLALMAGSVEQLAEKLQAYADGTQGISDIFQGQVKSNKEGLSIINRDDDLKRSIIDTWISQKKLTKLADLWVKGIELDWNRLYGENKPKRTSLPTYPFAKERYWFEDNSKTLNTKTAANVSVLHPLIHENISDLDQQCYRSVFSGEEFFAKDYRINGAVALSPFAAIEMARAAVALATSKKSGAQGMELSNMIWEQPILLPAKKEIITALFANDPSSGGHEWIDVEIHSEESETEKPHFYGSVVFGTQPETGKIDIAQLRKQMQQGASTQVDIYEVLARLGITYGATRQGITTVYHREKELLLEVNLAPSEDNYLLRPAIMDVALLAGSYLATELDRSSQPVVPHSLDAVRIISACSTDMVVWVRSSAKSDKTLDVDLMDQHGNVCAQMRGLSFNQFTAERADIENRQSTTVVREETLATGEQQQEVSQQMFFREYWKEQPLASGVSLPEGKQIVIFADEEFGKVVNGSEQWAGAVVVSQGDNYQKVSDSAYYCRLNNGGDIQKVLNGVPKSDIPLTLIYTWAKDQKETGIHTLFNLFKAIKEFNHPVDVILTGHYDPSSPDTCWDYSWIGFERSLKLLLPDVRLSLLYTDSSSHTPQQLLDAAQQPGIIWYKGQQRFALSFEPCELNKTTQEPVLKKNGSYLITGGCGELGFRFAHYLAREYQAKLILLGRRSLTPGIRQKVDELKKAGAQEVHYAAVDISNREALALWAGKLPFDLSGVIHAAGVESVQPFYEKTADSINSVLHPKSVGTVLLDEMLDHQRLDFVCYFSSSAALLGDFGSCDYAIANRFQMAYAYHRQQKKQGNGRSLVINWPFWKEGGMGKGDAEEAAFYLKSSGQEMLETAEGIAIWHDIIRSDQAQTLVMKGKPTRVEQFLGRIYEAKKPVETVERQQNMPAHISKGWKVQYQDLSPKECVFADLVKLVSSSLKIPAEKLDGITNLADYGFDSISLATFAKRLQEHFSLAVTPALFFNYATIGKLSEYFTGEHQTHIQEFYSKPQSAVNEMKIPATAKPINTTNNRSQVRKRFLHTRAEGRLNNAGLKQEPIAVIGMSGRFPKADTVDQLWTILEKGESAITEIPSSRWNWRDYFTESGDPANKISTNKGGFISNVDEFDPLFFEISPREAEATDPGQRLLLMEAYKAIEDAQIDPSSLRGSSVGVFVGMEESQYDSLVVDEQGVGNSGNAMISSRLSYYLDLHGPTIATNTACSSGLVALHQAIMSLRNGECESTLVAGISSFILSPTFYMKMSQAGMLSQDGQCYSFAKRANGIGVGEAVVVLMLKPLSAAIAAGNPIYGTIKGSGINFDGKTNGVTAPNGKRQEELIRNIYTNYSINPADISHIVAHGTGTKLGDPIELNALNEAFKKLSAEQSTSRQQPCAITSCKSNLGHTMAASGLVSVVSLLKGLQHNTIPATINCDDENDYITWEDSPFYINKATREWEKENDKPRMGGVSSFGRSGTNAHVVIEEYMPPVNEHSAVVVAPKDSSVIIALSAKTGEQLKQKASDLLTFISTPDQTTEEPVAKSIDLVALAYSLQVTREAMEVRLGFIVNTIEELADKLRSWLNAEEDIEGAYSGEVKLHDPSVSLFNVDADLQETIDKWITNKRLSKLLDLWVKGLVLDWNKLYGEVKPRRINVPKYPFAKERYWVDKKAEKATTDQHTGNGQRVNGNYELIEDILSKVEDESLDVDQAVKLLNNGSYMQ
ncbi:SDR family NAD(P)-dependent oxidoreductase [Fulvivirga imtechensis]|nr:SDR family NAD(P)-dependent oxidoreductase [Fulvivirga imtechensis]